MFTIDPVALSVITGVVLPVLLAFVMRQEWPAKLKGNITLVASLVGAFLVNAVNDSGSAVISWSMLTNAGITWAIAIATYNGYYKPVSEINSRLPDVGGFL